MPVEIAARRKLSAIAFMLPAPVGSLMMLLREFLIVSVRQFLIFDTGDEGDEAAQRKY
jgi:hypothetical protein